MSFTQEQLTILEAAIAEGVLSCQYADKKVQYRSLDEMLKLRDLMREQLGLTSGRGRIHYSPSKGLP